MSDRRLPLELSAFLDAPAAREFRGLPSAEVRRFATALLEACYEDLGMPPAELDGEHVRELLLRFLPARLKRDDPLAEHAEELLDAFLAHLRETRVVAHAFEFARAVDEHLDGFRRAIRTGAGVPPAPVTKTDPFVHGAAKTGRNDPCFCGSGKKFKKCHGKA